MFEAKVYRIAVTSLGAVLEEEHIAKETIQAWNNHRAESTGKLFLTQSTGTNVAPDLYVVIIDSFLYTPKVDSILVGDRPAAFFFSQYHDPSNTIKTEIDTIVAFREQMRDKYPCVDYRTAREFGDALMNELEVLP